MEAIEGATESVAGKEQLTPTRIRGMPFWVTLSPGRVVAVYLLCSPRQANIVASTNQFEGPRSRGERDDEDHGDLRADKFADQIREATIQLRQLNLEVEPIF